MTDVVILGVGQTRVTNDQATDVVQLASQAIRKALLDAGIEKVEALYVGNMLSGLLGSQQLLGPLIAEGVGMIGSEALTIESACASGAAAVRVATAAVQSGTYDAVVVCGVEHMTGSDKARTTAALATATHWQTEGRLNTTILELNAGLMSEYQGRYGVGLEPFRTCIQTAHVNAIDNPNALFRRRVTDAEYDASPVITAPMRRLDAAPICDGAAAIVIGRKEVRNTTEVRPLVRILASSVSTCAMAFSARADNLDLEAAARSCARAYDAAGLTPQDVDLFELHDAFSVLTLLSLEAARFAPRRRAGDLIMGGEVGLQGRIPISTCGGLKARGHPVGASGVYQIVDAHEQLVGRAGANQIDNPRIAMTQSFGGLATVAITHLLERIDG